MQANIIMLYTVGNYWPCTAQAMRISTKKKHFSNCDKYEYLWNHELLEQATINSKCLQKSFWYLENISDAVWQIFVLLTKLIDTGIFPNKNVIWKKHNKSKGHYN